MVMRSLMGHLTARALRAASLASTLAFLISSGGAFAHAPSHSFARVQTGSRQEPSPEPAAEPTPPSEQTAQPEPTMEPAAIEPTTEPTVRPTEASTSEPATIYTQGSSHSESSSSTTTLTIGTPSPTASPSASPKPSPTPNPWRQITVATKTLSPSSEGAIEILSRFAAARRDGKSAAACVSFKNTDTRTATRVLFEFALIDGNGSHIGSLALDRKGTFSTGVAIEGYRTLSDWSSGGGNRGYSDNCTTLTRDMAALPILSAQFATYIVKRVDYADGTSWSAPTAP